MSTKEVVLDLRKTPEGCTDHPIVRLNRFFKELREMKERTKVTIYAYTKDLPQLVLKLMVKKHGLKLVNIDQLDKEIKAILMKETN